MFVCASFVNVQKPKPPYKELSITKTAYTCPPVWKNCLKKSFLVPSFFHHSTVSIKLGIVLTTAEGVRDGWTITVAEFKMLNTLDDP